VAAGALGGVEAVLVGGFDAGDGAGVVRDAQAAASSRTTTDETTSNLMIGPRSHNPEFGYVAVEFRVVDCRQSTVDSLERHGIEVGVRINSDV
jgi:hypothetical protein